MLRMDEHWKVCCCVANRCRKAGEGNSRARPDSRRNGSPVFRIRRLLAKLYLFLDSASPRDLDEVRLSGHARSRRDAVPAWRKHGKALKTHFRKVDHAAETLQGTEDVKHVTTVLGAGGAELFAVEESKQDSRSCPTAQPAQELK